jgi:dolichol kinase
MRSCEVDRFSGVPYYLSAAILAIGIFPQPIAVLSILYLACGDPIASLFGILYGKKSIRFANGKSCVGTIAGISTCAVTTFIFLNGLHLSGGTLLGLTLIGGLAGGTAELLPFEVDDNFVIPIVSGFILWLAFILLGI